MDYGKGGVVPSVVPVVGGVKAITMLPNTGTSHYVVEYIAIASIALGVAILTSNVVRLVAKHRYTA